MKISYAKRIVIIGIIGIIICVAYLCGFYAENKISFSNSESEIVAEEVDLIEEITEEEILPSEEEICLNETEIENENSNENIESDDDFEGRTHREIIEETLLQEVNMCKCIDAYEEGNWFAYYVYADGDVYVITIKCNEIDIICQLN